ncbi:Uncharacterized protein BP5553_01325 [Venustampulla echinocandica]|uniref:Uncharacterized protein n=1 Tax=Venustampulla echinocandica TaxID=2656787 RepID=A0A370U0P0_9HELO|nr:Uncharacterized protein BP5553_01325 [Venustampulla echinocandica]RDL41346.1 Uncharacterized protein BP5553_01325 [Venustampulla echinocandica]
MEKGKPSFPNNAFLYHSSNPTNPSNTSHPSDVDDASITGHSFGAENAIYDADAAPGSNEEAPPAYLELEIEGGNVSAEVMRNGRVSILVNSSARIPGRAQSLDQAQSQLIGASPPNYADFKYPLLNIVIQVVGSRGDVQPFVALGKELQRAGHKIRLATHGVFESFVREAGLDFFSIGGDPEELMAYMVNNPSIIPNFVSIRDGELSKKRKMVLEMLEGCWRSCIEPDPKTNRPFVAQAIIANPPSFAHIHCAQALGIPVHLMFTMPWTATRAFPHPLANIQTSSITDEGTSNFMSYGLVELMTWQGLADIINLWRNTSLSLEPVRAMMGAGLADYLRVPFTYFWSPSLIPKPDDWPSYVDVCGFSFRGVPEFSPSPELMRFLENGPTPIYVGFGSIVMKSPQQMTETILGAVRMAGIRAIVSKGWSKLGVGVQDPNVFFLDDCPHEWLFKRVAAVVHHGGAGTTACGLLNGRPTAIVPFFGDQPFWGSMVAAAGAGPRPVDHKLLDITSLASAIRFCLTPNASRAAQSLAEKMSRECGVKEAVNSFHRNLPMEKMKCDILPRKAAVWRYDLGNKQLKLSDEAAFILMGAKKLEMNKIKPYQPKPIEIENKRWDPLTAGTSTLVDTLIDLKNDGKSMFSQPYRELQKANTLRKENSGLGPSGAAAASFAAGKGLGKMSGGLAKGIILDLPVAMADGFHAIPVLYGDKPMRRGVVTDWKTGALAGGKSLARGFYHGFTGLITDPAKGAIENGAAGFAKGVVTGSLGVLFKPGAAMLGFVGYPLLGAYKSIGAMNATPAESKILLAKQIQGSEVGRNVWHDRAKIQLVLHEFDEAVTMRSLRNFANSIASQQL